MQYEGPQPGDEDIMEGPAHLARESILPFIIAELTPYFRIFCPDTGDGNLTDEWTDRYIFRFQTGLVQTKAVGHFIFSLSGPIWYRYRQK